MDAKKFNRDKKLELEFKQYQRYEYVTFIHLWIEQDNKKEIIDWSFIQDDKGLV